MYISVYMYIRVCEHILRLSSRSLDAVRDSSREFLLFRVLLHICIQTFFPEYVWAIFLQLVCVDHEHEKERKRKGKTYFGMKNSGGCHPQSHGCHAAIFEDCQRERGMPHKRLTYICKRNGRNCLGKKKMKKKNIYATF